MCLEKKFLSIIVKSIKLDKTLYKDNKNFDEASIYFAIIIILVTAIIGLIPGSIFLNFLCISFDILATDASLVISHL